MSGPTIAAVALQIVTAMVAGWGALRCMQLQRYGKDPRLVSLAWFFGLFAASLIAHGIWEAQLTSGAPPQRLDFGLQGPVGGENVTLWLFLHHALMVASLAVAVVAFGKRAPPAAIAPAFLLAFSDLVPLMLAMEAALTLYLGVRAWLNHMERKSPGALQVALGFGLFFIGHLLFFIQHRPGAGRTGIGDVVSLVGIVLLVQMLPGRRG